MSPLASLCLFLGLALGCLCLAKVRDWPRPQLFTRRIKPEDVRISPEAYTRQQERERFAFASMKSTHRPKSHVVRLDFNRTHR